MPDASGFSVREAGQDEGEGRRAPPQRQKIIETVINAGITFWRDLDGNTFATVPGRAGEIARYRVRSTDFRMIVRSLYAQAHPAKTNTGTIPGSVSDTAMGEALPAFEAMGFTGPMRDVDVRVIRHEDAVWLDLGTPKWDLVRIDAESWKVIGPADVPMIRPEGMRGLPTPVQPNPAAVLAAMGKLLNVGTDDELRIIVAWLVSTLYPTGPYAILALDGEQGSGKSTTCRMLRRLVDANKADLRAPPQCEDDLVIAALGGRTVAIDNVSSIEPHMADALCRLATGGGLSKRKLYTDGEEHIVAVARPVLLNGIPSLLARGDLADRSLAITLRPIPDDKRRPEAAVWAEFATVAPAILGLLLDGLAMALWRLPTLKLERLPRMADFASLACACAPAFGWDDAQMLAALQVNRAEAVAGVIESDPLAAAVQQLMEDRHEKHNRGPWQGTASDLLLNLNPTVTDEIRRERIWPKTASRVSAGLKRAAPALRRVGLEVQMTREAGTGQRVIILTYTPPTSARSGAGGLHRDAA